jgi:hypothetical protein
VPRIRTLKPEITTDEKLARVSRDARLTFVFLITQADDDGLIPASPRQLLAALYPMDQTVTDKILAYWIKELVGIGVCRWRETLQGSPVLEIIQWERHQRIDHKGKSLLRQNLLQIREDSANGSRDSREDVAKVSRSDLGPRTMDHGPTNGAASPLISGNGTSRTSPSRADVETVVAHYVRRHPKRRPGGKDRKLIERHLATYSPAELCEAIDGNADDEWAQRTGKHELTWVLRDNGQIDTYRAKADTPAVAIKDGWFVDVGA